MQLHAIYDCATVGVVQQTLAERVLLVAVSPNRETGRRVVCRLSIGEDAVFDLLRKFTAKKYNLSVTPGCASLYRPAMHRPMRYILVIRYSRLSYHVHYLLTHWQSQCRSYIDSTHTYSSRSSTNERHIRDMPIHRALSAQASLLS